MLSLDLSVWEVLLLVLRKLLTPRRLTSLFFGQEYPEQIHCKRFSLQIEKKTSIMNRRSCQYRSRDRRIITKLKLPTGIVNSRTFAGVYEKFESK